VVKHGGRAQIVNATFKHSALWLHVHVMKLTRNMRVEALGATSAAGIAMHTFSRWLLDMGEGKAGPKMVFPADMMMDYEDVDGMIDEVFPDLGVGRDSLNSCILMPLNKDVNAMNQRILQRFPGPVSNFPFECNCI
jgi:hypothetical protein